jgi:hypothetical protein
VSDYSTKHASCAFTVLRLNDKRQDITAHQCCQRLRGGSGGGLRGTVFLRCTTCARARGQRTGLSYDTSTSTTQVTCLQATHVPFSNSAHMSPVASSGELSAYFIRILGDGTRECPQKGKRQGGKGDSRNIPGAYGRRTPPIPTRIHGRPRAAHAGLMAQGGRSEGRPRGGESCQRDGPRREQGYREDGRPVGQQGMRHHTPMFHAV